MDLAFSAQLENGNALPSWLTFDPTTRTFNGVATNVDEGSVTIRVVATDSNGLSVQDDFELSVTLSNEPISSLMKYRIRQVQGETFELTVQGANLPLFSDDAEEDGTENIVTADCPSWLTCSLQEGIYSFVGIPSNADVGTHTVTLAAKTAP